MNGEALHALSLFSNLNLSQFKLLCGNTIFHEFKLPCGAGRPLIQLARIFEQFHSQSLCFTSFTGKFYIVREQFDTNIVSSFSNCCESGCATAHKTVEDGIAWLCE